MKGVILKAFVLSALIGGFAVVSTQGQVSASYRAEIPFDFTIGERSYQAGVYFLEPIGSTSSLASMVLKSRQTRSHGPVLMNGNGGIGRIKNANLTFIRLADGYTLAEVNTPVFQKKLIKFVRQERATGNSTTDTRSVALVRKN